MEKILPILQSSLPPFERMLPYLNKIEANRCHSNFGKLFKLFEARLADFFGVTQDQIAIVCNGTLALLSGLIACNIPQGKYCLLPSWTFSATPAAAYFAGLNPFFLDVDIKTQTLTPKKIVQFIQENDLTWDDVGAVITVSPFGAPIATDEWDEFTKKTHIPVMIDAAAACDTIRTMPCMRIVETPLMISLHATKIFGIGEGGVLLSKNTDLIRRVKGISNFGFDISRVSSYLGLNAKMSEYQAAIGLAVLDAWDEIRNKRLVVTNHYINLLNKLDIDHWLSTEWLTNTCNILVPGMADAIKDYLWRKHIETRIWWGKGCHSYPAYRNMPQAHNLSNTAYLSDCMLGLPFSIDTSEEEINTICDYIYSYCEFHDSKFKQA